MLGHLWVLDISHQYQSYWIVFVLFLCIVGGAQVLKKQAFPRSADYPPVVNLTKEQIFNDPVNAYEAAIRENGPVIAVKKKGRMEIVVSEKYVSKVLVDEANFSFEKGVAKAMNMDFLLDWTNGTIFKDMAVLVDGLLSKRMNTVVKQVSPIFFSRATELANTPDKASLDLFEYCQSTVSDAMVVLLLGKKFLNHENGQAVMWAANDVAELGGIFQNRSWFARTWPSIWRPVTFVKVVIMRFIMGLGMTMGRSVWKEMTRLIEDPTTFSESTEDTTLLSLLVKKYTTPEKTLSFAHRSKIFMVLISAIFASVHQVASTMVWVLCELALRPEYQKDIFQEIQELVGDGSKQLDFDYLKQAVHTDSFIREVMRTKGDTFSTVRMSVNDVQLGGTIIPKGYTVHPIASLAHRSPAQVGENPGTFDGRRWVEKGKPATMAGPGHLAFGLGRWACPGRYLAVSEIKLMVFSVFSKMNVELVDKYEILDKLMIASAPPKAYFRLTERDK